MIDGVGRSIRKPAIPPDTRPSRLPEVSHLQRAKLYERPEEEFHSLQNRRAQHNELAAHAIRRVWLSS